MVETAEGGAVGEATSLRLDEALRKATEAAVDVQATTVAGFLAQLADPVHRFPLALTTT